MSELPPDISAKLVERGKRQWASMYMGFPIKDFSRAELLGVLDHICEEKRRMQESFESVNRIRKMADEVRKQQ